MVSIRGHSLRPAGSPASQPQKTQLENQFTVVPYRRSTALAVNDRQWPDASISAMSREEKLQAIDAKPQAYRWPGGRPDSHELGVCQECSSHRIPVAPVSNAGRPAAAYFLCTLVQNLAR